MTEEQIIDKLNEVLAEEFEVEPEAIAPDAPLMATLDLDSLDLVDVVVLIDRNFGVTLARPDLQGVNTFRDFYDLIIRKVDERG